MHTSAAGPANGRHTKSGLSLEHCRANEACWDAILCCNIRGSEHTKGNPLAWVQVKIVPPTAGGATEWGEFLHCQGETRALRALNNSQRLEVARVDKGRTFCRQALL